MVCNGMLQSKSHWFPLYVPFEKKTVFCMTKAEAHEVYGLSNSGVDARTLGEAHFSDAEWLSCFDEVPRRGSKVKCRSLKPDLWSRFYTLFTSVYQEPPSNYGLEVTKAFARGFLHEQIKGPVDWALFSETMISAMDPNKLQAKQQRWSIFHASVTPQTSKYQHVKPLEKSEIVPYMCVDSEAVAELDAMVLVLEKKHADALSELNEATRKVDKYKADMHRDKGAQLLVSSLKRQLEDSQCELQMLENMSDPTSAEKVQGLRMKVDRLSLTIQTVDGVVMDTASSTAGCESQAFLENAKQVEMYVRAQLDFVKDMHARKNKLFLSLPMPKASHSDLGLWDVQTICTACGLLLNDADGVCMFTLPCAHAYHIYCFAHLATTRGICIAMGCAQMISPRIRLMVMPGHIDAVSYARESQSTIPAMLPISAAKSSFSHGLYLTLCSLNTCLYYWFFFCVSFCNVFITG